MSGFLFYSRKKEWNPLHSIKATILIAIDCDQSKARRCWAASEADIFYYWFEPIFSLLLWRQDNDNALIALFSQSESALASLFATKLLAPLQEWVESVRWRLKSAHSVNGIESNPSISISLFLDCNLYSTPFSSHRKLDRVWKVQYWL